MQLDDQGAQVTQILCGEAMIEPGDGLWIADANLARPGNRCIEQTHLVPHKIPEGR